MLNLLIKMVDANMLAGWVRAAVTAVFTTVAVGGWEKILTPDVQTAVGVIAVTVVVGIWQMIAKMIAGVPAV